MSSEGIIDLKINQWTNNGETFTILWRQFCFNIYNHLMAAAVIVQLPWITAL